MERATRRKPDVNHRILFKLHNKIMNNLDTLKKSDKITVLTIKDNGLTTIDRCEYHGYEIDGTDTFLLHRSADDSQAFPTLLTGDNVTVIRGWVDLVYQSK
jgi:hypothetical protein